MKGKTFRFHLLAAIVGVFIALGLLYSTTVPLFEAPDEQWHFAYVQYVATGQGLPVQVLQHPAHLARQEGSQPPLYYVIAAAATSWVDSSDFPGMVWENPHYGYNVPGVVNDNKNLFIHTAREDFPYRGASLAIHLARLVSLLMGALGVVLTFLLTRETLPGLPILAPTAAALVAFVPQFLFVSSAVSNDSTIVAMSALSLWLIMRFVRHEGGVLEAIGVGAAAGLAALAKVSGLGLVVLGAVALVFSHRKNPSRLAICMIAMLSSFALVAGWWYARNWILYGELTGTEMMLHIFGARQTPLTPQQLAAQLAEVWETFWAGFGWGNIRLDPLLYDLLGIFLALGALGVALAIFRRRVRLVQSFSGALPIGILAMWASFVILEFFRWMLVTQAPHGRLLFPALPAMMPVLGIGLAQLAPSTLRGLPAAVLTLILLALAGLSPFLIISPAYAYPPELTEQEAEKMPRSVDINFGDRIRLLGMTVTPDRVRPGEAVRLELYWKSIAEMDRDYSIGIHVLDQSMNVIGSRDSYPGHGMLPTTLWRVGETIRDDYWVQTNGDVSLPNLARIEVDVYDRTNRTDLTPLDRERQPITPIIGRFRITQVASALAKPKNPTKYTFGNQIALEGYDLVSDRSVSLTLYWSRLAPVPADYTVFVHLLDAGGRILAQVDQQPVGGANPTSLWGEGEQVTDRYSLIAPAEAARLELGLYRADTGSRLEIEDAEHRTIGDHITLELPGR